MYLLASHGGGEAAGVMMVLMGALAAVFAFLFVFWAIMAVASWKIMTKAGKPGWIGLIPFYGQWVMMELVGLPGYLGLVPLVGFLGIIPILGFIINLLAIPATLGIFGYMGFRLAKSFGKDQTFAICSAIPGLSIICMLILAFDKSEYLGVEAAAN